MWIYRLSRTSYSKVGSMGENFNFKWTSSALLKTRAVALMKTLKFHIPCKLMQSGHYWRYIWIDYRPSALQRFHDTVPSWSEADALCGLPREQSALFIRAARGGEVRRRVRRGRGEQNTLDSRFEHKVKAVQAFCASAPFGGCAPFLFPFCSFCCSLWIVFTCWFQAPSYSFLTSYLVFISAHTTAAVNTKEKQCVILIPCQTDISSIIMFPPLFTLYWILVCLVSIEASCLFQVDECWSTDSLVFRQWKKKKNYAAFKRSANLIPALNRFDLILGFYPLNPGFLNGHMQPDEQNKLFCLIKYNPNCVFLLIWPN